MCCSRQNKCAFGFSAIIQEGATPMHNSFHKLIPTEGAYSLHNVSSVNAILQDLDKTQMRDWVGSLFYDYKIHPEIIDYASLLLSNSKCNKTAKK